MIRSLPPLPHAAKKFKNRAGRMLLLSASLSLFLVSSYAQVSVTDGGPGTNYTNFTNAFNAVNNGSFTGDIIITVTGNVNQNSTADLNADGAGSANYTSISINSSASWVVSGSVAGAMIYFDGADNVTIDGSSPIGPKLIFRNTSTNSTASTIYIDDNSDNYLVDNCNIEGAGRGVGTGVFRIGDQGNDNITVQNCDIHGLSTNSNTPTNTVHIDGTNSNPNTGIEFTGNNIYDWFHSTTSDAAMHIENTDAVIISGNNFFQTTARTDNGEDINYFIDINGDDDHFIRANNFGGSSADGSGQLVWKTTDEDRLFFIRLSDQSSAGTSVIDANTFKNIQIETNSAANYLIEEGVDNSLSFGAVCFMAFGNEASAGSGNFSITNNIIGSSTTTAAIDILSTGNVRPEIVGVNIGTSGDLVLTGNTLGGLRFLADNNDAATLGTGFRYYTGGSSEINFSGNLIGSETVENSIQICDLGDPNDAYFDATIHYGSGVYTIENNIYSKISVNGEGGAAASVMMGLLGNGNLTARENVIKDVKVASKDFFEVDGLFVPVSGILALGSGTMDIVNNKIRNLQATNSSGDDLSVLGITLLQAAAGSKCHGNLVEQLSLFSTGNGNEVHGIKIGSGPMRIYNNAVLLVYDTAPDADIFGITSNSNGDVDVHYNTVILDGTQVEAHQSAAVRNGGSNTEILNNILFNYLNVPSGSGTNRPYAFLGNTNPALLDYNTYAVESSFGRMARLNGGDRVDLPAMKAASPNFNQFSYGPKGAGLPNLATFFTDPAGGDCRPNPLDQDTWLIHGFAKQVAYINTDCEGVFRPALVSEGTGSRGAYEFTPATTPLLATEIGTPGSGNTTSYVLADFTMAEIQWAPGATEYPASVNVYYHSGIEHSNVGALNEGQHSAGYWEIAPDGNLVDGTYNLTVNFGEHESFNIIDASIETILEQWTGGPAWLFYKSGTGSLQSELDWNSYPNIETSDVTVRNLTTFNDFILATDNSPLPISLLEFSAQPVGNRVLTKWITSSEVNNDYFTVQRSKDGANFEFAGIVGGAGNSNVDLHYAFYDETPYSGLSYYRLMQTDFNKTSTYSDIVSVFMGVGAEISIFPNPTAERAVLRMIAQPAGSYTLTFRDLLGRVVKTIEYDYDGTSSEFDVALHHLAPGQYIYNLRGDNLSSNGKLIINQ